MDHCSEIRIPILRRPHANTTDDLLRRRLGRRDQFLSRDVLGLKEEVNIPNA
jgi:hypothetical protein